MNIALFIILIAAVAIAAFIAGRRQVVRSIEQLIEALRTPRSPNETDLAPSGELKRIVDRFQTLQKESLSRYESRLLELDHERSKTDAIIESVEDGLIVLDQNHGVVHINEVACAILDLDPGVVEGKPLEEISSRNLHVAKLLAATSENGAGAGNDTEFKLFLRGRDHSYISRNLPWMGPNGERLGTIVLLQDVTYVRDQERSRTNLIATLSHELKTPLTSLTIGAGLLTESIPTEVASRQREILDTIHEDVSRLNAIATDLLDASRKSSARIGVERRAIMLDKTVREACRPLAIQAREKKISFEVIADERPIPIWGDPIKLPWVITNLVGNALRYTPQGGTIELKIQREGNIARTIVTDTGPGIAPDILPRIFEPFAQFPDEAAHVGSAGLGLYIAKEIVEAHNGRIFARSELGNGTTFTVDIPMREEAIG
ncbi:MAG TPA: ATP-binding protein [Candidatus Binataceae bacterium]|nr:ATP-binding protein [Candidatus Binataceae bacterium]